jgi:hypothetical protein
VAYNTIRDRRPAHMPLPTCALSSTLLDVTPITDEEPQAGYLRASVAQSLLGSLAVHVRAFVAITVT